MLVTGGVCQGNDVPKFVSLVKRRVATPCARGYSPGMHLSHSLLSCLIAAVAVSVDGIAAAQQVIVRTDATAVTEVASQSSLVIAELEDRAFSAPLFTLADHDESIAQSVFTGTGYVWSLNPRDTGRDESELLELPIEAASRSALLRFQTQSPIGAIAVSPPTANAQLAVATGSGVNALLLVFQRDAQGLFLNSQPAEIRLPGRVQDLAWLPDPETWVVLYESAEGSVVKLVRNVKRTRIPVAVSHPRLTPQRVVCMGDTVLVISSGYDVQRADGASMTTIQAVHPGRNSHAEPVVLRGAPIAAADAVYVVDSRRVWVTTQSRGTPGATASLVRYDKGLTVQQVVSLPSAEASFHVVVDPSGESALFAAGRVLQHHSADGDSLEIHRFDAAVRALVWDEEYVIVGEGNRVHRLSHDTLTPARTIRMYSGLVADIARVATPLPALGDADGDGILDTVDARPGERIPGFVVPRSITLQQVAPGRAVRIVPLDLSVPLRGYRYKIDVPAQAGLICEPETGVLPGVLNLRLESGYRRNEREPGPIRIGLSMYREGTSELLSSATIDVTVESAPEGHARILVVPTGEDDPLRAFGSLLTDPPHSYLVAVDPNPTGESLASYQVVVITLEAALAGRISRVELERYTANGGGLLIVGSTSVVSRLAHAREWLIPFRIDVRSASATLRTVRGDCDWCDVWTSAGLRDGLLASVEPPGRVMFMPGRAAREGPMARTPLGLGRLVFVGSEGLLLASTASEPIREAVLDAVHWLVRTRSEVLDRDGDGLADDVEDANGNGILDAGETDPSRADTDGDLVVDGLEDLNGNGRVDEGETDPRTPDTDGDRIPDGADFRPLERGVR